MVGPKAAPPPDSSVGELDEASFDAMSWGLFPVTCID
jgi:hypothetical protein